MSVNHISLLLDIYCLNSHFQGLVKFESQIHILKPYIGKQDQFDHIISSGNVDQDMTG